MVHSINTLVSPSSMIGKETVVEETNGDIDLNLSLSLNGRFGVDPQRTSKVSGSSENGAELKMWPSLPTGKGVKEMGTGSKEVQSLALMNANKRSLDCSRSSTITYFHNRNIEGHGFPSNIGCTADKSRGKSVEVVADKVSPKAIPAEKVKGREFDKVADMPKVFTTISGQMIKGFLAKYNVEEIRILCVCHAFSMTPAQFIKHAGGGDVARPERYIFMKHTVGDGEVINPPN